MNIIDEVMKIAMVFFCYAGDAALLRQALRAVPVLRAAGAAVDVFLCDDAAAPLGVDNVPEWVRYYRQTGFYRGGNLNGLQCIEGMVEVYADIMTVRRYAWVVKVDCDTYVNSLEWLRRVDAGLFSFVGTVHVNNHASGACYAVSRGGVELLAGAMREARWRGAAERARCEDRVLYNICRCVGNNVLGRPARDGRPHPLRLCHDWELLPRADFSELRQAAAVDFKRCRWNSEPGQWQQDAAVAVERMKQYADYVEGLGR